MTLMRVNQPNERRWLFLCFFPFIWAGSVSATEPVAPPSGGEAVLRVLSIEEAVRWALENNPELAALREQHGIAAAAVIIAQTYPFNPIWEAKVRPDSGPESAGITNRVSTEQKVLLEVEVHHQRQYRMQEAAAALSRTDWEIAFHELTLAVRVIRAFNSYLYRQEKLRLSEEIVRLNDEAAQQISKLVDQARLRPADLILARTEVDDARAQLGFGRQASISSLFDLRRALGAVDECIDLRGSLETTPGIWDCQRLTDGALESRPDLQARRLAMEEAEARLQLAIANRCGNPVIGPAYEYNETRVNFIGVQFALPLPAFNRHLGEIQQRQAEKARVAQEVNQVEVLIRQDVQAALARLDNAHAWLRTYKTQIIPNLQNNMTGIERLFTQGDPGVDVLRVLDVRRKLLKARNDYLDALWEASQARADLVAAVGNPALILEPCQPGTEPAPLTPPKP